MAPLSIPCDDQVHLWWLQHRRREQVLADYLGCRADSVSLSAPMAEGNAGRPSLAGHHAGRLSFSTSHSGDTTLLAVGPHDRDLLGVDLELCDARAGWRRLAHRVLSPDEFAAVAALKESEQAERWTLYWTGKEAYLKAVGTGLSEPPNRVVISFDQAGHPRLVSQPEVGARLAAGRSWDLQRVTPPNGSDGSAAVGPRRVAVLAVAGAPARLSHHLA